MGWPGVVIQRLMLLLPQCGGYGTATAVYSEQLSVLRQSDMDLIDYVEVVEKVYGFL